MFVYYSVFNLQCPCFYNSGTGTKHSIQHYLIIQTESVRYSVVELPTSFLVCTQHQSSHLSSSNVAGIYIQDISIPPLSFLHPLIMVYTCTMSCGDSSSVHSTCYQQQQISPFLPLSDRMHHNQTLTILTTTFVQQTHQKQQLINKPVKLSIIIQGLLQCLLFLSAII